MLPEDDWDVGQNVEDVEEISKIGWIPSLNFNTNL